MAEQGTSQPGTNQPSMSEHLRQMLAGVREAVRPLLPKRLRGGDAVVPVVRLSGTIGLSTPLRPGLTLASIARPLEKAFTARRASAVALLINSPGGSPVQSHLIHLRIRQLAAEHKLPVLAFGSPSPRTSPRRAAI
jgi:ClpP class serine protease